MIITNNHGIPDSILSAVKSFHTAHKKTGDYSVTGIIKPVQMIILEGIYKDQLTSDVVDNLWSLMGSAMHNILEHSDDRENVLTEYHGCREISGTTVSGTSDVINLATETITDYKLTSVWTHIGGVKPEWKLQLSIYRWLFAANHRITNGRICCLFRDWSKGRSLSAGYPSLPFMVYGVPLFDETYVEYYLYSKIANIKLAKETGVMVPCTDEERWASGGCYAVMKKGRKSAVKLHETKQSAISHKNTLGTGHSVVERPPEYKRCANYCAVSKWCEQNKRGMK